MMQILRHSTDDRLEKQIISYSADGDEVGGGVLVVQLAITLNWPVVRPEEGVGG